MSANVRAVRADAARSARQLRGLGPYDASSYLGRRHAWGWHLLRHPHLYRRGPRRVRLHTRPTNHHAVAHALHRAAWGGETCRPLTGFDHLLLSQYATT